jgi:hypothetical protein
MKDIPVLFWALAIVLFCTIFASAQVVALEAEGASSDKEISLSNAYVSAHFKCNRKGIWADLNTLKVKEEYTTQYKIPGGKKKITEYRTKVEFKCTEKYRKVPDEG